MKIDMKLISYVIIVTFAGIINREAIALKDVRATIPEAALNGSDVMMGCSYDLEGEPLYTLKWYKGEHEFYRFTPREVVSIKSFPVANYPELVVDRESSNTTHILLKDVDVVISGRYGCEVTTDAPSFHARMSATIMHIVILPMEDYPTVLGNPLKASIGDEMVISCNVNATNPPANLTWTVNRESIDDTYNVTYVTYNLNGGRAGLWEAESTIRFILGEKHFKDSAPNFKIRCTARIYKIYQKVNEVSILLKKPPITYQQVEMVTAMVDPNEEVVRKGNTGLQVKDKGMGFADGGYLMVFVATLFMLLFI